MYDNNFLFNYMFFRSKPKKFLKRSKAASLAFQSSLFSKDAVGSIINSSNLFEKEKNLKLKKDAVADVAHIETSLTSLSTAANVDANFLKANITNLNHRLVLAKILGFPSDQVLTSPQNRKVLELGGLQKLSPSDIMEKVRL